VGSLAHNIWDFIFITWATMQNLGRVGVDGSVVGNPRSFGESLHTFKATKRMQYWYSHLFSISHIVFDARKGIV
jgi:hypothetical protein